jgi:hypothetical protein
MIADSNRVYFDKMLRKEELIRGLPVTPSPCHQKGKRKYT